MKTIFYKGLLKLDLYIDNMYHVYKHIKLKIMKTRLVILLLLVLGTKNIHAQKEQKFFFNAETILTVSPSGKESSGPGVPQGYLITLHSAEKIIFSHTSSVNGPIHNVKYNGKNSIGISYNTIEKNKYCVKKIYQQIIFKGSGYALCEITKRDFIKERKQKTDFN